MAVPAQSPRAQADLALFEKKVQLSKELGATHMLVTEGLPLAMWEMDASDPYPMWFVGHAGLLTIFPRKDLQPGAARTTHRSAESLTQSVIRAECRPAGSEL